MALTRNTAANRRWYGGGMPVAVEPHQFWPMNAEQRKAAGLERNRDIVDATVALLAGPDGNRERQRSGTWATVRYARGIGNRPVAILPR
jgi:hypothetical protein